jgi:hypothetical protein
LDPFSTAIALREFEEEEGPIGEEKLEEEEIRLIGLAAVNDAGSGAGDNREVIEERAESTKEVLDEEGVPKGDEEKTLLKSCLEGVEGTGATISFVLVLGRVIFSDVGPSEC